MDSNTLKSAMVILNFQQQQKITNSYDLFFNDLFLKSKFDVYLSSPDNLIIPQFNLLIGSNIRLDMRQLFRWDSHRLYKLKLSSI
jgi:hypothetical protein